MENLILPRVLITIVLFINQDPVYDCPSQDEEYRRKFPEYGYPNIWPEQLPQLSISD